MFVKQQSQEKFTGAARAGGHTPAEAASAGGHTPAEAARAGGHTPADVAYDTSTMLAPYSLFS